MSAAYVNIAGLKAFYAKLKAAFAPTTHAHTAMDITGGVLSVARGGTGQSTTLEAAKALGRGYCVCGTAAATAAKTAALSGFTRVTGAIVAVRFTNANSAEGPTLNIGRTGAAAIINCYTNAAISAADISAGMTALVIFNGTSWVLLNPAHSQQSSRT